MAERILGPTDSRRRRRFLLVPMLLVALAALFVVAGAQAVHDTGAFELDGNATNGAAAGDDWDNVCHEVTGTDCSTTSDTSGATAVSWIAELNRNSSIFTGGHSKDPDDVSAWIWKDGAGGLPDKDNLEHGFAARYSLTPGPTCPVVGSQTTCEVLFFGSDRFDNSGDAQEGFWFLQNPMCLAGIPQQDGSPCPNTNPGKFVDPDTGDPAVHAVGDILILSDFSNGGDVSTINVYEWVGTGGDTNGTLQSLGGGLNRSCGSALPGDSFCGIVNPGPGLTDAPWPFTDKSGNSDFLNGEFFEGGLNLSALSAAAASECFASFVSETRSATSATATLKDFVLGQFAPCKAEMSTTPSKTSVIPGEAVHDTATITGSSAAHTPSGSVEFFLCSFAIGSTEVCDGTVNVGTSIGSGTLSGSGATATADSPDVNTAANPLTPGHYCFRAHWPGDSNYTDALDFDGAAECFDVAKIPSVTVTTPVDGSGVETHTITLGSSIFDKAVVTGTAAGGDPTGDVNFFVCGPIASGTCATGGTAVAGNPKALVSDGDPATFTSSATSGAFTPTAVGRYCFRADYLGSNVYLPSSDSSTNECFVVNDTTSTASQQTWRPNDSATVTSTHGAPLSGSLSFTLHAGTDCTGTVLRPAETFTFTNATSPVTRSTTNTTVDVTASSSVSWEVVFASTNPNVSGSTKCETTTLTITN
jgi:hypothetical protein